MSCERSGQTLDDAVFGERSAELEEHLSRCGSCRTALARERALLDRIDAELQDSLEAQPSPAFLPAVRRRVADLRARREAAHRGWLVPTVALLAGVLVAGHLVLDRRGPVTAVAPPVRPAEPRAMPAAEPIEPMPARAPGATVPTARPAPAPPKTWPKTVVAPSPPRVVVPAEDAEAVRRLARRLRGRAASAAVLAPRSEATFDFMLESLEGSWEVVTGDRVLDGAEPRPDEPPSFEGTNEETGRET